jgi:hypothetical protein
VPLEVGQIKPTRVVPSRNLTCVLQPAAIQERSERLA